MSSHVKQPKQIDREMIDMQRLIEFTTDDSGAEEVESAVKTAFSALTEEQPKLVRLAYWRLQDTNKFVALIELEDEKNNPLLNLDATAALPKVIGSHVEGGYPMPQVIELIGSYGFDL
jgi:hypothetical protein